MNKLVICSFNYNGIKGGIVRLKIIRETYSFDKTISFENNSDFDLAKEIISSKAKVILSLRNNNEKIARLASYLFESEEIKLDS